LNPIILISDVILIFIFYFVALQKIPPGSVSSFFQPEDCIYEEVESISRTMHIDQFTITQQLGDYVSTPLNKLHGTKARMNKAIWFRAATKQDLNPVNQDWFGNVRMDIDYKDIINPEYNYFIVDYATFLHSYATRVIVTKQHNWPGARRLDLNYLQQGDPFLYSGDGKLFMATKTRKSKREMLHRLHFIVDVETVCTQHLYRMSKIVPVNHTEVNKLDRVGNLCQHQCLQFNGGLKTKCPYKSSARNTLDHIIHCQGKSSCKHFKSVMYTPASDVKESIDDQKTNRYYDMMKQLAGNVPFQPQPLRMKKFKRQH